MSISAFRTYEIYCSLKLHFTSDKYSSPKYKYKTRNKYEQFEKNPLKYFFEKFSNKFNTEKDAIIFFSSQFIKNPNFYIKNHDEESWKNLLMYIETQEYRFKKEMKSVLDLYKFNEDFYSNGENYPLIVHAYVSNQISFITLAIFYRIIGGTSIVKPTTSYPIIWKNLRFVIDKFNDLDLFDYKTLYKEFAKILV